MTSATITDLLSIASNPDGCADASDLRDCALRLETSQGFRRRLWPEADPALGDRAGKFLAMYIRCQIKAMGLRADGKVSAALIVEGQMETIHNALPSWARW